MGVEIYLFSTSSHPDAISINSLDIELLNPRIDFSEYDYLIITSKQTSNALEKFYNKSYTSTKALCISEKSAEAFEKIGGEVLEMGSGYGDNLVDIIQKYPKDTKWLYLRAEIVASDFVQVSIENGYKIDEKVVYRSKCSQEIKDFSLNDEATLIFTSPSSVECFLLKHKFGANHKVIVIGTSTAKALPKGIDFKLSNLRTIQSCIDLSKKIL
jgi:uroporphyrinogen-III synthase